MITDQRRLPETSKQRLGSKARTHTHALAHTRPTMPCIHLVVTVVTVVHIHVCIQQYMYQQSADTCTKWGAIRHKRSANWVCSVFSYHKLVSRYIMSVTWGGGQAHVQDVASPPVTRILTLHFWRTKNQKFGQVDHFVLPRLALILQLRHVQYSRGVVLCFHASVQGLICT